MTVPTWFELVVLALAAFRVWRLLGKDVILDRPRRWLVGLGDWREGDPVPAGYREWIVELIECPRCLGTWVALAFFVAFELWPHGTMIVASACAIAALVAIAGTMLDPD